ncbi:unnamed protein product [Durusdinium trenchii]|uniref:Uncharacterized protein n=1 Tax=Durusdinium trenchii TaxID=1381693 RepID=A0ABP0Q643_9DINO
MACEGPWRCLGKLQRANFWRSWLRTSTSSPCRSSIPCHGFIPSRLAPNTRTSSPSSRNRLWRVLLALEAEPTALSELRRILAALPQMPGPSAEEFVVKLKDEQTSQALKAVNTRSRSSFFGEVRQNLYRLSEASQKELVESFTELKAEVVKLVDSMTQEPAKSQWLQGARWSCWSGWTSWLKDLMNSKCTVVAWKTAEYGFVKREGRHNDDIQLHVANAKGERFKKYVRRYGLQPGVRVKFDVDFEENRGRPFASNWEMVDPPHLSASRSRSGRSRSRCHSHGPKGLACLAQCEAHSGLAQRETAWKSRERAKSASGKKKGTSRSRDKKRSRDRDRRKRKSNSTKRRSRSREKNDRKKKSLSKSRDREKPKRSNASKSRSKSKCEEEKSKKAVLSASFQANFKQIGAGAKRAKEAFLLQMAVCLKTVERRDWPGLSELSGKMRRCFFYVEGYGELMEDWLQSRTKQLNEEFLQRGTAVLGSNFSEVLSRLRQIFRPGRWMFLSDPRVEGDLIGLLEDSIPRHVLSISSLTKFLELVGSSGGEDFHIYNDIVRLPPLTSPPCLGPKDLTESTLLEVLKRLPGFPPLLRTEGRYRFGRVEVVFQLTGTDLAAQVLSAPQPVPEVLRALDFFLQFGPQEFPNAAAEAVQASDAGHLCPTTQIQDLNATSLPLPTLPTLPLPSSTFPTGTLPMSTSPLTAVPPLGSVPPRTVPPLGTPLQGAGFPAPMPPMALGMGTMGGVGMAVATPAPVFGRPKFGIDDDEI